MPDNTIRITEIFLSLQGEAATAGFPTVFVRLTGCPLRCQYCDSEYAFYGGEKQSITEIIERVGAYGVSHVCVTGGEPLAQPECLSLLAALADKEYSVSLETSGAMPIDAVDERISIVMDLKTPDSGEVSRNRLENISLLAKKDQVKFVICSRQDYEWARFKITEYALPEIAGYVFLSPSFGQVEPTDLANWLVADRLPVRMQTQLHKALWGDKPGV